jgi:hypothetical protein
VFVRTFQGDFTSDFPIQLPEGQSAREGSKRFNFTLGSGSARIEVQSFNGDIILARKAILTQEEARRIRRGQTPQVSPPAPPAPPKPPKPPKGFDVADLDFDFDFDFDVDVNWEHEFDHLLDAHEVEFEHPNPTPLAAPPLHALPGLHVMPTPAPSPIPVAPRVRPPQ